MEDFPWHPQEYSIEDIFLRFRRDTEFPWIKESKKLWKQSIFIEKKMQVKLLIKSA